MSVPVLRFKDDDGRDFAEWKTNLLGSYAEAISSGKSNARNGNGRYILYGSTGLIGYADDYDYQGEKLLIARVGANAGYLYRVEGEYCVSDNTLMLTLKKPHNYSFFFNLLTKKNLNKLVFGSGQPLITGGHLKNIEVSVPSLPEQIKVAKFLTAVDEKITQLTQKHNLLTQYKKGVMQQIFSQELRFKDDDGRDFPEWEEKLASDVFVNVANKNHDGELPILAATQDKGMIYREDSGLDIKSSEASVKSYKIVEKGDFVISLRSFQGGIEYSSVMGICSPAYTVMKPKIVINDGFFKAYLKKEDFIESLNSLVIGIRDGKQISYSAFATLKIPYPSIKEQTKIANFLNAIEDKITATQAQLGAVKHYKQGLLQQMFV